MSRTLLAGTSAAKIPLRHQPLVQPRLHVHRKFGDARPDPYYWLRNRKNPNVLKYIKAENAYVESVLKPTKSLQQRLFRELRGRVKQNEDSVPYRRSGYYYLTRYKRGQEYPIYLRRKGSPRSKDQIILDVNKRARGHKYCDISRLAVSVDTTLLGYAIDTVGRRFYDIQFRSLISEKNLPDTIKNTTGNFVWLNDNKTILYTKQDPQTLRPYQVYKYTIGGKSQLLYEEKDSKYYVALSKSLTTDYVFIYCTSNQATEVHWASANESTPQFHVFYPRQPKHEYSIIDGVDRFFILSNHRAKNFQLFEAPKDLLARKNWRTVIAHNPNVLLEEVLVFESHIVLQERRQGLTQLSHFARHPGAKTKIRKRHQLKFPDPTYVTHFGANAEYKAEFFRFEYQSMTQPGTTFDHTFKTKKNRLVKREKVPTYNAKLYKSERIFARSHDGVKIPVSLVYKKKLFRRNQNPLYVYAYGSYGLSVDTYFYNNIVSLLDRGFVFAIPHIRGGSELGRHWYEDGKLLKKKNTFRDFISATEHLINEGYGRSGHVYAMGGSAGGLLMGAVANMRPDLYRGMIAAVPFVDVLTTMLDESIPLTTYEYDEWGNPNERKYYNYIKSYSPYDNVTKKSYPHILVTTGFHDSQVQYWEPAKWVAKLRTHNTSGRLILFKTDLSAGHSGTTGRFKSLKEDALDFAFLLMLEGLK